MEFEKKLLQLEQLVTKLESKDISLEEGISIFEQGLSLTKECLLGLSEGKNKVALIKKEMDKLTENPFND